MIFPDLTCLITPANEAFDPGSAKTPSVFANNLYACKISSSDTISISPQDCSAASTAYDQLAGLPMRIAVAIVSGSSITCPFTIAAAHSASKP